MNFHAPIGDRFLMDRCSRGRGHQFIVAITVSDAFNRPGWSWRSQTKEVSNAESNDS